MKLPIEYVDKRRKYILFKNDCGVTDCARDGRIYEQYIFDWITNNLNVEGKTILDVGANFGFHSLEFADLVGASGTIHSFEPQKLIYYQLCGNVILNGHRNITCHNLALSDTHTTLKMENPQYESPNTINIGNSHLDAFYHHGFNYVDVQTLDSFEFNDVAVLKIDVQGYEPKVLDGARETIAKHKPVIFIEVELPHLQIYGFNENSIFDRLSSLGYSFEKLVNADHIVDYIATPNI